MGRAASRNRQASAGVAHANWGSQGSGAGSRKGVGGRGNRRCLSAGDGRRGVQEASSVDSGSFGFIGSILVAFAQAGAEFLQAVAITPGGRVGGQVQQFTDFFKRMLVPDFQDDDFALFRRQLAQAAQG